MSYFPPFPVGKATLVFVASVVLITLLAFFFSVPERIASHFADRKDAQHEKVINEDLTNANQANDNATLLEGTRQAQDAAAQRAEAARQQAARNSNQTAATTQRARVNYEKARRHLPVDAPAPAQSDDELCAELTRRQIPCR
jgi:hypothetical protein